jgi:hypothetical protein
MNYEACAIRTQIHEAGLNKLLSDLINRTEMAADCDLRTIDVNIHQEILLVRSRD